MAVVGSTIMIDFHLTEEGDVETVRGAVRQGTGVHPTFAGRLHEVVEETARAALDGEEVGDYSMSVDVSLVADRVPGAPRERITVALDFEGTDAVVAAVDDAVTPPDRAELADALEAAALQYLRQRQLGDAVDVTVSVTPIQFR